MVAFANKGNAVIIMTNADNGGKLIGEILRSVSNYYNWGISKPKVVEVIDLPVEYLKGFVGTYKLNFQVSAIGDYLIEITIVENQLQVYDPNNGETNTLTATEDFKYIDLITGDEVTVKLENNIPTVLFNNQFTFYKEQK